MLQINPFISGFIFFLLGLVLILVLLLLAFIRKSRRPGTAVPDSKQESKANSRSQELAKLAQFVEDINSPESDNDLLSHLVESIHPMLSAEFLGFLLYDSHHKELKAKSPFLGLHAGVIDWTSCTILPGSKAEDIWKSREAIITTKAHTDARIRALNLNHLAKAAGIKNMVLSPLKSNSHMLGYLLAGNNSNDPPFNHGDQELLSVIAGMSASLLENAKLTYENKNLNSSLEKRVNTRTVELAREHQRTETLLRIITELSASLDLEHVLNRTLQVLKETIDAEQISVLIHRPGEAKLRHLASAGYMDVVHSSEGRVTAFDPGQGLAGWVITQSQPALIPNILEDPRWTQLPETATDHRSAIGVPLAIGEETFGALLLFHREVEHFSEDQLELVQAAAKQMSIAVNNAELYRLIRDQAEDLGHMFREQQIETSRSQAILEAVADGVIVTDANRRITLFNAAAEQILRLDRTQIIDQSLSNFSGLFGQAAKTWMETIQNWYKDPGTYQKGELYTEQINLDDEQVVSVHLSPVLMRGKFLGTVSIFRDITHQVEVDRLKSDFVATVSHELRTPMTSIRGYVDILLMGAAGSLNEQQAQFLGVIKRNTKQLSILVNDLFDVSRIESGKVNLNLQELDIVEIINEAINGLIRLSKDEDKKMLVEFEPDQVTPAALGDRDRVRQILNNLLENAFHYTPEGGVIKLRVLPQEDEVEIRVSDNGIGIPPEIQPQIFDRFYRGEHPNVLATSGTGLGLAIVKSLVEMHNGRIWIESSGLSGEGTTFYFTLPIYNNKES
jgi:PAS domain S-box-containing protein